MDVSNLSAEVPMITVSEIESSFPTELTSTNSIRPLSDAIAVVSSAERVSSGACAMCTRVSGK